MFGPKTLDTTGRAEFVISREKRNSVKQLTKPRKVSCKIPQKSRLCGERIKCSSQVHKKKAHLSVEHISLAHPGKNISASGLRVNAHCIKHTLKVRDVADVA